MWQRGFTPHRLAIPREGHVNGINHEHIIVFRAQSYPWCNKLFYIEVVKCQMNPPGPRKTPNALLKLFKL